MALAAHSLLLSGAVASTPRSREQAAWSPVSPHTSPHWSRGVVGSGTELGLSPKAAPREERLGLGQLLHRRKQRIVAPRAFSEDAPAPEFAQLGDEEEAASSQCKQWDSLTARIAESATVAFLLLQLPQIILNTQNLVSGNIVALTAVPWMGQLTGLLGNLSLLSYFAGKRERGAMVVQAVGVLSTGVVLSQLALGEAMPVPMYMATAAAVAAGLLLNWLSYFNKLRPTLWQLWLDSVTVGGLTVLPQVMWSTFVPFVPASTLPGTIFGAVALLLVILNRLNKLPPSALKFYTGLSAWTATLLFMWSPVAQAWSNYLNPSNIKGLSVFTILLAMTGNGLLLPRALFTRDLMWFTGSAWGTLLQGWGILVTMFIFNVINGVPFYGISAFLALWLGWMFYNDAKAYSLRSPVTPLVELVTGSRSG